jgi:hypothetical protein
MKLSLKAVFVAAAIAMTFQLCDRFIGLLPLQEWLKESYYIYFGAYYAIIALYSAICLVLTGFLLYKNQKELLILSPAMKIQAKIICGMMIVNLLWHLVYYSVGAENIAEIYTKIGGWWLTAEYLLLTIWLWQVAIVAKQKFESRLMGTIGLSVSCIYIVSTIAWLVFILVSSQHYANMENHLPYINAVTASNAIYGSIIEVLLVSLILGYYGVSRTICSKEE